jgi:hypothetical protein
LSEDSQASIQKLDPEFEKKIELLLDSREREREREREKEKKVLRNFPHLNFLHFAQTHEMLSTFFYHSPRALKCFQLPS